MKKSNPTYRKMKNIAQKMEKMGEVPFNMPTLLYIITMIIYVLTIPFWLPIYLMAKWIEIYKED